MSLPETKISIDSTRTSDQPRSLELNVKILTKTGLWPLPTPKQGWLERLGFVYPRAAMVMSSFVLLAQIADMLSGSGTKMEQLTENIYVSLITIMGMCKSSTIMFQGDGFQKIVRELNAMNREGLRRDANQRRIFDKYNRYTVWITKGFMMMCGVTCVSYLMGPVLYAVEPRPLPYRGYLPWNTTVTPNYQLTYAWFAGTAVANSFLIGICDTLFVSMLITAIGQFRVLQYKLEHVRSNVIDMLEKKAVRTLDHHPLMIPLQVPDEPDGQSKPARSRTRESQRIRKIHLKRMEERFYKKLAVDLKSQRRKVGPSRAIMKEEKKPKLRKFNNTDVCRLTKEEIDSEMERYMFECADHHQRILSFTDDIESLFNWMLTYQFMASLSLFCMVAYQTTKSGPEDPKFIALLQLLVSAITELFMYCWFSAELTDQSLKVNEALYMCKWENMTPSFNHAMTMILLRANKAVNITAAHFLALDLDIFRRITKTSYSFYTLLTQLDGEFSPNNEFSKGINADSFISSNF